MAIKKTYGSLKYYNNKWEISSLEPHAIIKLKALFSGIRITAKPPFVFKDTLDIVMDLEWFMHRYPLEMDTDTHNKLQIKKHMFQRKIETFEKILSNEFNPKNVTLKNNCKLRYYQNQAVELVYRNKSLLLGDDLGLGKTVSGIGLLLKEKTLPAFVVTPPHLASHWDEKIKEFTNLSTHIIKGTQPYELPNAEVFIIKYSCLKGWSDLFETFNYNCVIFDEVHYLRRAESLRYEAAESLVKNAEFKLGLSASPIFNYGDEIYNILNILNEGCLGFRDNFLREWTTDYQKVISNPKALGTYLRDSFFFLRRTPEDVGRELPTINKIVQNIDFDHKTVKDHEDLMKALALKLLNSDNFNEQGVAARELNIMVRKITGISKARAVAEYVKILLDNGRPVILTGWHRDVYEIWEESFADYNPSFYTGSETTGRKDQAKNDFISGKSNLLIISLRSGEGIDGFQYRCKDIVFGELDWSPAVHDQLIGRINRDGQKQQVMAHFLVSNTGSDPLMIELLGLKASQAKDIVDPNAVLKPNNNEQGVSKMKDLAERILKK
jgi:SNF2 family DNA or RNA helicase